jgi:hypothetical protein
LDPDLFGQIRILERTMAVRSQLNSELKQNPLDLRTQISNERMRYFMDGSFKKAFFKGKKVLWNLSLDLNYGSIGQSRDTVS